VSLAVKILYASPRKPKVTLDKTFAVDVVTAFESRINFVSTSTALLNANIGGEEDHTSVPVGSTSCIKVGDPLVVHVVIENVCEHNLEIRSVDLLLAPSLASSPAQPDINGLQANGPAVLRPKECVTAHLPCTATADSDASAVSLGCIHVAWGRTPPLGGLFRDEYKEAVVTSVCAGDTAVSVPPDLKYIATSEEALPLVTTFKGVFSVQLEVPSQGVLGEALCCSVLVRNHSVLFQELAIAAANTEAFLFAGYKSSVASVLPFSTCRISFQLVPIVVGHVTLPHILISSKRWDKDLTHECPTRIFVKPSIPTNFQSQPPPPLCI